MTRTGQNELWLRRTARDDVEISPYLDRLDNLFSDHDNRNVAILGPYGCGKSSVLRSYLKKSGLKYISLEVAESVSLQDDTDKIGPAKTPEKSAHKTSPSDDERAGAEIEPGWLLESRIVTLLRHSINTGRIPKSSVLTFHETPLRVKTAWLTLFLLILTPLIYFYRYEIFRYAWWLDLWDEISSLQDSSAWLMVPTVWTLLLLCALRVLLRFYLPKIHLGKISAGGYELTFKGDNIPALDRYREEIVYMLKQSGRDLVVFEDLDRLGNVAPVLEKLRFINSLVNASRGASKKLMFCYVLRDDVLSVYGLDKFFDDSVTVVPVMHHWNSLLLLLQCLDFRHRKTITPSEDKKRYLLRLLPEQEKCYEIDSQLLKMAASTIRERRTLHRLCNDVRLAVRLFASLECDPNRLFAMCLYRLLYADDYGQLIRDRGVVYAYLKEIRTLNVFIVSTSRKMLALFRVINERAGEDQNATEHPDGMKIKITDLSYSERTETGDIWVNINSYKKILDYCIAELKRDLKGAPYEDEEYLSTVERIGEWLKMMIKISPDQHEPISKLSVDNLLTDMALARSYDVMLRLGPQSFNILDWRVVASLVTKHHPDLVVPDGELKKLLEFMLEHGYITGAYTMYMNVPDQMPLERNDLRFLAKARDGSERNSPREVTPEQWQQIWAVRLRDCALLHELISKDCYLHLEILNYDYFNYLVDEAEKDDLFVSGVVTAGTREFELILRFLDDLGALLNIGCLFLGEGIKRGLIKKPFLVLRSAMTHYPLFFTDYDRGSGAGIVKNGVLIRVGLSKADMQMICELLLMGEGLKIDDDDDGFWKESAADEVANFIVNNHKIFYRTDLRKIIPSLKIPIAAAANIRQNAENFLNVLEEPDFNIVGDLRTSYLKTYEE